MPSKNRDPKDLSAGQDRSASSSRRPYTPPEIILELELETRAGSPMMLPDPYDPYNLDPYKSYQGF